MKFISGRHFLSALVAVLLVSPSLSRAEESLYQRLSKISAYELNAVFRVPSGEDAYHAFAFLEDQSGNTVKLGSLADSLVGIFVGSQTAFSIKKQSILDFLKPMSANEQSRVKLKIDFRLKFKRPPNDLLGSSVDSVEYLVKSLEYLEEQAQQRIAMLRDNRALGARASDIMKADIQNRTLTQSKGGKYEVLIVAVANESK